MKKLLLLLLLSLGFIGSAYAAKNAGLALAYGFGSVSIAVAIGGRVLSHKNADWTEYGIFVRRSF